MESQDWKIAEIPGYRALGYKWEGSYAEVGSLKEVIYRMSDRVNELDFAVNPETQLGLSYHLRPDGFVHYSAYEVTEDQHVPEDMVEFFVPRMTYLTVQHQKGQNIGQTYESIFLWMGENGYKPYVHVDGKVFDKLPVKHERYPHNRDLEDPHFEILIPIEKISQVSNQ
ncbi:GyrI-like domain-containing protein [Thalassobacillus hwangdonensis]|uniref:GyrI-like domain-containing protein n=1 Tax=Thalassobacillus hwangdonensis TaxID=546108 RepID=A0ABW3KZJ4_9BACI